MKKALLIIISLFITFKLQADDKVNKAIVSNTFTKHRSFVGNEEKIIGDLKKGDPGKLALLLRIASEEIKGFEETIPASQRLRIRSYPNFVFSAIWDDIRQDLRTHNLESENPLKFENFYEAVLFYKRLRQGLKIDKLTAIRITFKLLVAHIIQIEPGSNLPYIKVQVPDAVDYMKAHGSCFTTGWLCF
jgi:hypothetical protein